MLIEKKKLLEMIELTGKDCKTIPILEGILLEQKDGNLCFQWTNLSETIEISEPVEGKADCALVIPKKMLKESVEMLREDEISIDIDVDTGRTKVSDGKIDSIIKNCFPADDFPELPKRIDSKEEELDGSLFLEGLKKVLFAVSTDENRLNLCGVHIEFFEDSLQFTATDGRQLANWRMAGQFAENQFILSTESIVTLSKLLKRKGILRIRRNKEYAQFELDNVLETFRLQDGEFPKWRDLFSTDEFEKITLNKKEFAEVLKTTSKIETSIDKKSFSKFIFDNGKLTIETENVDRRIRQKMPYDGDINITITLDNKVLARGVKQIENSELEIWLKEKSKPIAIKENNYQYFLMPILKRENEDK